jgi:endonuclease/exonuclease/phosphatase family metal-dependent hydrolase
VKSIGLRVRPLSGFALVALTTVVSLETLRVLFPKLYGLADREGNTAAAVVGLVVFSSAILTPIARRALGEWSVPAAVGALAGWRLFATLVDEVPLGLAVAGTVAALLAMTLLLTFEPPGGSEVTGVGLLAGLGLDAALRSLFITWDPAWQRGAGPLALAVLLAAAVAVSALTARGSGENGTMSRVPIVSGLGGGLALAAVLALEVCFLLSPGFVASSASISLAWGALVVIGSVALALVTYGVSSRLPPTPVIVAAAGVLAVAGFLLPRVTGAGLILAVAGAQAAAGIVLGVVGRPGASSRLRAELGLGLGWVVFVLIVLLYQIHFDQPLPFNNRWVVTGAGVLTLLAARGRVPPPPNGRARGRGPAPVAASVVALAVLVAVGLATTNTEDAVAPRSTGTLRVVEWNVRQAVTENSGQLAPDRIASVLARDGTPDIVVLPESARGWPLSGDLDLASWLSRRLNLPFTWGPAADNQFGTLVLSRLPIAAARVVRLPVAGRSQGRSLLLATLDTGGGGPLTLLATHLQHHNDDASMAARLREIQLILSEWKQTPHTLLMGDFNPRQGDPPQYPPRRPGEFAEIRAFLDAGFTTAQDLTSCSQPTSGRNCSDFVLVTPDLRQELTVDDGVGLFDHRPVRSVIRLA